MSDKKIKSSLRDLHQSLEDADSVDQETRDLLRQLDDDVHRLLMAREEAASEEAGFQERLESLATDFESHYPQLSRMLRELGDALARVGI